MANRFLDRNMGQIIASTNEAISTIMSLRKLRWDYAIDKAKMNYSLNREQDNRNWQMNLEMFKEQKADERINQQMNYNKIQSLNKAKADFEQQFGNITRLVGHLDGAEEINNRVANAKTVGEVIQLYGELNKLVTPQMITNAYRSRVSQPKQNAIPAWKFKGLLAGYKIPHNLQVWISGLDDNAMIPTTTVNKTIGIVAGITKGIETSRTKLLDAQSVLNTIALFDKTIDRLKSGPIENVLKTIGMKDPDVAVDELKKTRDSLLHAFTSYKVALDAKDDKKAQEWADEITRIENANSELLNTAYNPNETPQTNNVTTPAPKPAPVNPNTGSTGKGRDPFKTANEIWEKMKQQSGKGPNG